MKIPNFFPSNLNSLFPSQLLTTWRGRQVLVGIAALLCIGFFIKKMFFGAKTQQSPAKRSTNSHPDSTTSTTKVSEFSHPDSTTSRTKVSEFRKEHYSLPAETNDNIKFTTRRKKEQIYQNFPKTDFIQIGDLKTTLDGLKDTLIQQGYDEASSQQILQLIQEIPVPVNLGIFNTNLALFCSKCVISKDQTGKIQVVFDGFIHSRLIGSGSGFGKMYQEITELTASHDKDNEWLLKMKSVNWIEKKVHPLNLLDSLRNLSGFLQNYVMSLQSLEGYSPIKAGVVAAHTIQPQDVQGQGTDQFLDPLKNNFSHIEEFEKLGTQFQDFVLKAILDEKFSSQHVVLTSCDLKGDINNERFMRLQFMVDKRLFELGLCLDIKAPQQHVGFKPKIESLTIKSGFYVEWQKVEEGQALPQLTICK